LDKVIPPMRRPSFAASEHDLALLASDVTYCSRGWSDLQAAAVL
jgi:hypothetical protein